MQRQETFFAELTAELERRAEAARAREIETLAVAWDEMNELFTMQGGIANYHAGYGDMGDLRMVI